MAGQPDFTETFNRNGFEAAQEDEGIEDTAFRLLTENGVFEGLDPHERELFLLEIAQKCISWVQDRENY